MHYLGVHFLDVYQIIQIISHTHTEGEKGNGERIVLTVLKFCVLQN